MTSLHRAVAMLVAFALGQLVDDRPAQAAPTKVVHVLELAADFEDMPVSQALTSLLRLRVGDGDDFSLASDGPNLLMVTPSVRCDTRGFHVRPYRFEADRSVDKRCLHSIGAHLEAKQFFWGHLYHEANGRLGVKLHLWRDDRGDVVKALPYDEATRERLVERLYLHVVRPEEAADVKVEVPAEVGGDLYVDGRGQGAYAPGLELTLQAGEHAFELRRENKVAARAKATVVAGRSTEVRLEMVALTDVPIERPTPPPSVVTAPLTSTWKRPAGFAALGVGAAFFGAGIVASLRVNGLHDDFDSEHALVTYRTAATGSQDACEAAESDALSSQPGAATPGRVRRVCAGISTLQVAQVVLYGVGALAVGTGVYLLATSPSPNRTTAAREPVRPAWSLYPWAGANGGGMRLDAAF
jgi:hypothetical protein